MALLGVFVASGCYHYRFDQRPTQVPAGEHVTFTERRPTYLNGFIGTGVVDTTKYCEEPLRTDLRVTAVDVLLSVATLLIYTPHTLYVTCPQPADVAAAQGAAAPDGS